MFLCGSQLTVGICCTLIMLFPVFLLGTDTKKRISPCSVTSQIVLTSQVMQNSASPSATADTPHRIQQPIMSQEGGALSQSHMRVGGGWSEIMEAGFPPLDSPNRLTSFRSPQLSWNVPPQKTSVMPSPSRTSMSGASGRGMGP